MSHVGLPSVTAPIAGVTGGVHLCPSTLGHHPPHGPCRCHLLLSGLLSCWQMFHPETTDIYDKKNMPRVVYCIHALRWLPLAPNWSCWCSKALWWHPPIGERAFGCCRSTGRDWSWCASALPFSLYLFKLGLAPQIQDLYGKVDFTGTASLQGCSGALDREGCGE